MIELFTHKDLLIMREAGKLASSILRNLHKIIVPGISTAEIEMFFEKALSKYQGMQSAFRGFAGYPASLCVSVNEEIIHGIPSPKKILKIGDIVSVDLGIKYKGLFVDTAYTYIVGSASNLAKRLIKVTKKALEKAIRFARIGNHIGDIGFVIQKFVEERGFSVIKKFVGHGIGRDLHCEPEVPNFGIKGSGQELVEGMVIAIEPMVSAGDSDVEILEDGWTVKTKDNSLSAHFEHTIAITKKGPWVLTA